ncbi:hypothetical protein [Rhodanobacter koreensis]
MKKMAGFFLASLLIPFGTIAVTQSQTSKTETTKSASLNAADMLKAVPSDVSKRPDPALLLDINTPINERQNIFSAFEKLANDGDTPSQYIVGSIYRIGQQLPASPVKRDVVKAQLYLSNAATHGEILAMAKMAEIELSTDNYLEAMNWAQIFGHYAALLPQKLRPSPGYTAELIERIDEKFDRAKLPDVVKNVNIFIANYDNAINAGIKTAQMRDSGTDIYPVSSSERQRQYMPETGNSKFADLSPRAGFVEFLIVFKPDGSAQKALVLDSIPDPHLGKALSYIAAGYRVNSVNDVENDNPRYAWVPVMFDDNRYRLSK